MDDILNDFSTEALSRANEDNLASWLPAFSVVGEVKYDNPPGVNRSISQIPMSLFNSIMDTQLEPDKADAAIEMIIADAKARNGPALWWIGPSTLPADMAERLIKYGFNIDEDGPGMAVELSKLNQGLPVPDGLSIRAAVDEPGWLDWCRAITFGFESPPSKVEFAIHAWTELLKRVDLKVTQPYTAYLHGKPVATSLLQLGGGVAGIYAVCTIPEARRKGVGAQVTLYPLLEARRRWYKIGVLQSSEMGYPVYRSLGFQECCRITSYVWRPPT